MATVRTSYNNPAEYNRLSWRHFDFFLLLIVLALVAIGILMISSATQNSVDTDLANAARRQALYALIGVIVLILTATIDYRIWYNARHILYVLSVIFLVITLIFGSGEIGGVGRWLDLSVFPVQPAELAKVLLILALAGFLANRTDSIRTMRTVVFSLIYIAIPADPGLRAAQPQHGDGLSVYLVGHGHRGGRAGQTSGAAGRRRGCCCCPSCGRPWRNISAIASWPSSTRI